MPHQFNQGVLGTAVAIGLFTATAAGAVSLYDPALNTLPSAQSWTTLGVGPYTQSVSAARYQFSTLAANATQAGSARFSNAALDTQAGFTLDFNLRVAAEAHANADRAGFSFIVTGLDPTHSLEIGFWGDHVWAYTGTFQHGLDAALDTGTAHEYSLSVSNDSYSLLADGTQLFAGTLVDYSGHGAPYNQAGFIFFGDDTSSARSQVELGAITVSSVPEPATTALLAAGLLGLALRRRLLQS